MEPVAESESLQSQAGDRKQLLYVLMIAAMMLPLSQWMFSISLPVIRDEFNITADMAALISIAFLLPFMILMPIYGRISDNISKRRLLVLGISIFAAGSALATFSSNMASLVLARVIQGFGAAGVLPLSLALITKVFPRAERGEAMGLWSMVGPIIGIISPILAGFIVATWSWRASFIPGILVALISILSILFLIPAGSGRFQFTMLKTFDWLGAALLSATLISLLFFFSSRPISGYPPLQDWRLLLLTILFLAAFVLYEKRRVEPFVDLHIFKNLSLVSGSVCASLRMVLLAGFVGFLMPLYLSDVIQLDATRSGLYLMVTPAAMTLFTRLGGSLTGRLGSRLLSWIGFSIIAAVMFAFSQLSSAAPHWLIVLLLFIFGIGTGLMLAVLHYAALNDIPEADLGTSSGIYSMIRFLGAACGAAFGGILLQFYLDQSSATPLAAYQHVFQWFVGFAVLGLIMATFLPKAE